MYRYSRVPTIRTRDPKWILYRQSLRMDVTLHPGEALFIPAGWFHFVHSTTVNGHTGLNVALSCMLTTLTTWADCTHCVRFQEQRDGPEQIVRPSGLSTLLPIESLDWKHVDQRTVTNASRLRLPLYVTDDEGRYLSLMIRQRSLLEWVKSIDPVVNPVVNPLVYTTSSLDRVFRSNQPWNSSTSPLHVPWDQLTNMTIPWYIMQHQIDIATLQSDFTFPLSLTDLPLYSTYLWINNGNVQSEMHYDMYDNLLISIQGRKRVLLFPVDQESCLFPLCPMPRCPIHCLSDEQSHDPTPVVSECD